MAAWFHPLSHAVVVFGYNPVSYSFGENSGSSDVSVSISSGDPGAFQLLAQYQTQDLVPGGALGKFHSYKSSYFFKSKCFMPVMYPRIFYISGSYFQLMPNKW